VLSTDSRRSRLAGALLLTLLLVTACSSKGEPSPDFEVASQSFYALYGKQLDDAYHDPQMERILALLRMVPESSSDYARAQELLRRIRDAREKRILEESVRAGAAKAVLEPLPYERPSTPDPAKAVAGPADAGASQPVVGMSAAEFGKFSGCFQEGESLVVEGRGRRETQELRDITNCRDRHPGFDQKILVFEEEKVLLIAPKSSVRTEVVDSGT
jgi:hypothetical protein